PLRFDGLACEAALRLTMPERARDADTLRERLIRARPRNRRDARRVVGDEPDPRQRKLPVLNGDATRFVEHHFAFALADDEPVDAAQHRVDAIEMIQLLRRAL